jgi:hypothetical protein
MVSIYEIVMLVCFGAAWPASIVKAWRSRSTGGKSLAFLVIIFVGYAAGTLHKLLFAYDAVMYLYILNGVMVGVDIAIFFRNRRIEQAVEVSAA